MPPLSLVTIWLKATDPTNPLMSEGTTPWWDWPSFVGSSCPPPWVQDYDPEADPVSVLTPDDIAHVKAYVRAFWGSSKESQRKAARANNQEGYDVAKSWLDEAYKFWKINKVIDETLDMPGYFESTKEREVPPYHLG